MNRQSDQSIEHVTKVLLDLTALFLAANLSFDLRYMIDWPSIMGGFVQDGPAPWGALYQALPYILFGWFVIFEIFGLYRPNLRRREEVSLLIKAQLMAFAVLFSMAFFYRGFSYSRFASLFLMPLSFLFTLGFRMLYRMTKEHLLQMKAIRERVVIVGRSEETETLVRRLNRVDNPYQLVGMLVQQGQQALDSTEFLGNPKQLGQVLTRNKIDRVLVISGALSHEETTEVIQCCSRHRVVWGVVPDLYDMLVDRLNMDQLAGIPVMGPVGSKIVGLNLVAKRIVDIFVAGWLFLVLSPLILAISAVIKLTSKGPVFFIQKRAGRGGEPFNLYKFRSMYVNARDKQHRQLMEKVIKDGQTSQQDRNGAVYKLTNDPRITPVGRFIRRFSLDELPQLLNVIKGDMSLIGPRPAIPYEVKQYCDKHLRRLECLPGITGLWQVSGRNRLSFDQMVDLDVHYIENWSVGMDIRIFFKTIAMVLFSKGY